jgi:hypothetical protein
MHVHLCEIMPFSLQIQVYAHAFFCMFISNVMLPVNGEVTSFFYLPPVLICFIHSPSGLDVMYTTINVSHFGSEE